METITVVVFACSLTGLYVSALAGSLIKWPGSPHGIRDACAARARMMNELPIN